MTNTYYQLLALLYEKIENEGFLNLQEIGVPICVGATEIHKEVTAAVLHGYSNTECYKLVDKLVNECCLDKDICEKIKYSQSLRYMLCENLHDSHIEEIILEGHDLKFVINCGDCMGKPIINGFSQTRISVKFLDVKNSISTEDNNHIKDFEYVGHDISFGENIGLITFKIRLLKQSGGKVSYRDIVIHCNDIFIEVLPHEY